MGNSGLSVSHNAYSPNDPALRSALSGSLEEYGTFQQFFQLLVQRLKDPLEASDRFVVNQLEITDYSSDEFDTKVVLSEVLVNWHLGKRLEGDIVKEHHHVRIYESSRKVVVNVLLPGPYHGFESHVTFLENPLRMELWTVDDKGNRIAGRDQAYAAKQMLLLPMIKAIDRQNHAKVTIHCDVAVPGNKGRSAMTGPLGEYFTYTTLFPDTVDDIKKAPKGWKIESSDIVGKNEVRQTVVHNYFCRMSRFIKYNASDGRISVQSENDGGVICTEHYTVHREPLHVECYVETRKQRLGGSCAVKLLSHLVQSLTSRFSGKSKMGFLYQTSPSIKPSGEHVVEEFRSCGFCGAPARHIENWSCPVDGGDLRHPGAGIGSWGLNRAAP